MGKGSSSRPCRGLLARWATAWFRSEIGGTQGVRIVSVILLSVGTFLAVLYFPDWTGDVDAVIEAAAFAALGIACLLFGILFPQKTRFSGGQDG